VTAPASLYGVGEAILAQLQAALEAVGWPSDATAYVGAGSIAWDDCCGQIVVNPERTFRYLEFPAEATGGELSAACYPGDIGVIVSVVVLGCIPVVEDTGAPPDGFDIGAAHAEFHRLAAAVWNSLDAGLPDDEWELAGLSQNFLGPEGGCLAVETRFAVGLEEPAWCVT